MHVTYLCMRGHGTATATDRNERTVPALFLVWVETLKPLGDGLPPHFFAPIDVSR
jgi:hypothetical protein